MVYSTQDTVIEAGGVLQLTATCPTSHVVTGGGASSVPWLTIYGSYPNKVTGGDWVVNIANTTESAVSGILTSYAICAPIGWKS